VWGLTLKSVLLVWTDYTDNLSSIAHTTTKYTEPGDLLKEGEIAIIYISYFQIPSSDSC